ncbi:DUF3718 domain-containing protein [Permianibacter sp. IMCC34836]|uniref:DUF3718 domain-containing protein n=1 Tax=Permianibacter fluminis TaxID=2738515 RepID=UPI0015577C8F|nr:DUF3718 domain-containing protein [Permianibacter fluminis]NQD37208.1 DUF3718 domain-containing protein [Permianibacter fluminis]
MKKRHLLLALLPLLSAPASNVQAADDDYARLAATLCDFARANDRTLFRKKIKDADLQLRRVYGGILCGKEGAFNGGSLLRTAIAFNATDVTDFILSQVGNAAVSAPEHDGKTILQWTEEQAASDPAKKPFIDMLKATN